MRDHHPYIAFFDGDKSKTFARDRFERLQGLRLTKEWAEKSGFQEPVVIQKEHSHELGMKIPVDLTVQEVVELVGPDTKVAVIGIILREMAVNVDVLTQKEERKNWTLKKVEAYYYTPADQRDRIRNVMYCPITCLLIKFFGSL
jgi:hypothetical protein